MIRKMLLAALLLAFFVIAPALAGPDTTYYTQPAFLNDDSGLQIEINSIVASDLPKGCCSTLTPRNSTGITRSISRDITLPTTT
jgi:hypothetical protein